jgi:hypothetical protein
MHHGSILIKRTNSMHQCADIYLLQRQTLHVSGVTAPILRSSKNQATVEGSSSTNTMTYTRGSRYSFWNS